MAPERTAQTYNAGITAASKSVLLEVMTALRAYRDALILVGGWVPYLLLEKHRLPNNPFLHIGSIDIDVAVDPAKLTEQQYATIMELLEERERRFRKAASALCLEHEGHRNRPATFSSSHPLPNGMA